MMLVMASMMCVFSSCSRDENLPEKGDTPVEQPNGIPSNIPNNIIYYITSDNIIVRFENEDVFGGAKIVSNTYSSTKGYGTIEFASEVTAIERLAFEGKTTLTYIVWPNSVTSIGKGAFCDCSGLISVHIPNSVTSIGDGAFAYCSGLTSVTIPNSVTSIGDGAFQGCSSLTSVTIPNSVTSIENDAFRDCSGLTSVTIPNSVTSIGFSAFLGCSGLTSVTIPNSVTSIGEWAFEGCHELLDVYCYAENVPDTYSYAFIDSPVANATLHVPAASVESYKATKPWSSFGKIVALTE